MISIRPVHDIPSQVPATSSHAHGPSWFVWALFAALMAFGLYFINGYLVDMPLGDEVVFLPYALGERHVTLSWLWSQHNNHRLLLPRLIYLAVWHLCGHNFRAGMYLGFFLLSASAAAALLTVRAIRGNWLYSDAIFPLALMNLGHAENFLSSFNSAANILTTTITMVLLCTFATLKPRIHAVSIVVISLAIILLPLTTGTGVLAAISGVAWAFFVTVRSWRSEGGLGRTGFWLAGTAVVTATILALYFLSAGSQFGGPSAPPHFDITNALQAVTMAVGPFLAEYTFLWKPALLVFATPLLFCAYLSVRQIWSKTGSGSLGAVWSLIAGMFLAAGAIGTSRSFFGAEAGLQVRYALLLCPLVCALYLAFSILPNRDATEPLQFFLFFIAALVFTTNCAVGYHFRDNFNDSYRVLTTTLNAGWSEDDVVDATLGKGNTLVPPWGSQTGYHAELKSLLGKMREARIGPFSAPFFHDLPSKLKLPSIAAGSATGYLDAFRQRSGYTEFSGWAVCNALPSSDVILVSGNSFVSRASGRIDRPDVKAATGVNQAGFSLLAPKSVQSRLIHVYVGCPDGQYKELPVPAGISAN